MDGLAISGLTAGYPHRPVLRDLTLPPLQSGSVTALVGPNGAGKSTLLRVLAGLIPASGTVDFAGENLLTWSAANRATRVALMPQGIPQGVHLTVLEGVLGALHASPLGEPAGTADALESRALAVLERLDLLPLALSPLDHLSGGERQLASLAQALVREPRLLLLDEPTSALDLRHQARVMAVAREVAREGRIVVAVLHDLTLAARWADHLVILHHGRVAAAGAPDRAITPATLEQVYGVRARVEPCSQGFPQVIVDGLSHVD